MRVTPPPSGLHRRPTRTISRTRTSSPTRTILAGFLATAIAALAGWLALVGPQAAAGTTTSPEPVPFRGEELLRGLLFGVGPAAEAYPQLVYARIVETPENLDRLDAAIAEAERRRPGLLDAFGAALYSGDTTRVRDATLATMAALDYRVAIGNGSGQAYFGDDPNITAGRPQASDPVFERWVRQVATTLAPAS